jgi:catechol 2,3-dioxygenase-like lactoylglutathione lyase family enzyme
MTNPAAPQVDCEKHHASLSVSDVLAAVDFYTNKLGFSLGIDYDSHGSYRFIEG